MSQTLSNMLTEYTEYKRKFKQEAQALIKGAFKEMFELYPQITAFTWTQYTPYFNDGEPCEFQVCEVYITNLPPDELEYVSAYVSAYGEYDGDLEVYGVYGSVPRTAQHFLVSAPRWNHYKTDEEQGPACFDGVDCEPLVSFLKTIQSSDFGEVMQSAFGDHVQVAVTRDGVGIAEHYHD